MCELGNPLRDIVLYSTHIGQNRLIWFFLCAHQLSDVYLGLVRDFEDRNYRFAEFRVGIDFLGPNFLEMDFIEVIDHAL